MGAHEFARALGRRGGRARALRLSAADRKRIASQGGKARVQSLRAARRIADNAPLSLAGIKASILRATSA